MEEYQSMKRKELQALCKMHGIPANKSNLEMANLLALYSKVNENCISKDDGKEIGKNDANCDVVKRVKKVRFSSETEMREYEPTTGKRRGGRRKLVQMEVGKKKTRGGGEEKVPMVEIEKRQLRSGAVEIEVGRRGHGGGCPLTDHIVSAEEDPTEPKRNMGDDEFGEIEIVRRITRAQAKKACGIENKTETQKGKVGRGSRKRLRNLDVEVEASVEPREEIEEGRAPLGSLGSRKEGQGEGGEGGGVVVGRRKYLTRRASRKRGNDEGSNGVSLLDVVPEERVSSEEAKRASVAMKSKRKVRKDEGTAILSEGSEITETVGRVEDDIPSIANKNETIEVQDESGKVLKPRGNALGMKCHVWEKGVESDIPVGKGVEQGKGIRRSMRNVVKFTDSEPIPREVVRRITRFGAKSPGRNASRRKSVAPENGKVRSDGLPFKKETRKISRNSDLEAVIEVEASVESRNEIEKAIVPIGRLRRSRRNTVSLNSNVVTDEFEIGQAVGRMNKLSEQVSGKEAHVMDEPLRFCINASRHTSITTSNEMDENIDGGRKVVRRKRKREQVLKKETPAVVGESSVGEHTNPSSRHVSKNELIELSVSSRTVEKKQPNKCRLATMYEDKFTEGRPIEHTAMTLPEATGEKNQSILNCSEVVKPSSKRGGSKRKSSGIDFMDVSAVYSEAEEDIDAKINLEETWSTTSLKLACDSTDQQTPEPAREPVDVIEAANIVVHDTNKLVPDGLVECEVEDQSFRSLESDADLINSNSAETELAEFQTKACDVVFPSDSFPLENQSDFAGTCLEKSLERGELLTEDDISHENDYCNNHSTEVGRKSGQDDGMCGLEMTEHDSTRDKNEYNEVSHNAGASPAVGREIVTESTETSFKVDGNVLPTSDASATQVAKVKDNVVPKANSFNVSELSREDWAQELEDGEGIHLITLKNKDTDGDEHYSAAIFSINSPPLCTSQKDNDEHQQVSSIGSKKLSICVNSSPMDRNMQHQVEDQLKEQHASSITESHATETAIALHEPESFLSSQCDISNAVDEKSITKIDSNCAERKAILEGLQADALPQYSLEEFNDDKEGNTVMSKSAYNEVLSQGDFGNWTGEKSEVKVHFHEKGGQGLLTETLTALSSPELLCEKLHDYKEIVARRSVDAVVDVPISNFQVAVTDILGGKCFDRESDTEQCEVEEESGHAVEVKFGSRSACQEAVAKENTSADPSFTQAICQESEVFEGKGVHMVIVCSDESQSGSKENLSVSRLPSMIEEATVAEEAPIECIGLTMAEATADTNHLSWNSKEVLKTSTKRKGSKSRLYRSRTGFVDVSPVCSDIKEMTNTGNLEEIQAPTLRNLVDDSSDQEIPETSRHHAVLTEEANPMFADTQKVVPDGIPGGHLDDQSCQFLKRAAAFVCNYSVEPAVAELTKTCDVMYPADGFSSANQLDFAGIEKGLAKDLHSENADANNLSTEVNTISTLEDEACSKVDGCILLPIDDTVARVGKNKEIIVPEGNSTNVSDMLRENLVHKLLDGEGTCLNAAEEKDEYSAAIVSLQCEAPGSQCTLQNDNNERQQVSGIGNKRLTFCLRHISTDKNIQHRENQLEDQPMSSFIDTHSIQRADTGFHELEDFISYTCNIDNAADKELITKTISNYEYVEAASEGIQADTLCQSSLEELHNEKGCNTTITKNACDDVFCQKNFGDCIDEKQEEASVSLHRNNAKELSLEASTAFSSLNSRELLSESLHDCNEIFSERNYDVVMDVPISKLCAAATDVVSGKCSHRVSDIEKLEMEEESWHSAEIELSDHIGLQKVDAKTSIGADRSFMSIGEKSDVSEEQKVKIMIVCSSDSNVASKEMIGNTHVEMEPNAVQCAPVVKDENAEYSLVVEPFDDNGCMGIASKVNYSADANLASTIFQEHDFSEGNNIGLRDNTPKNVKRIDKLKEENKFEVGDSKANSFAKDNVDHLDEEEDAEMCDNIHTNGKAASNETHVLSMERLDVQEGKKDGASQQSSPGGLVKVFSNCGGEISDAATDAFSEVVSLECKDFDKKLNEVVDTVLEIELMVDRLDKVDALEPERSAFIASQTLVSMDAEAAEMKENVGKTNDDLKLTETNTDDGKDHINAIQQVTPITQHMVQDELENGSDQNVISNDACRNIKVDADESRAVTIGRIICLENSDDCNNWAEKTPISLQILESSRKPASQNSLEEKLFVDKCSGRSEIGSSADTVSEPTVFSFHRNGEQVEKSDGEVFEDNLISKDSWLTMMIKVNASIMEQLDGHCSKEQLGEALHTVTDEPVCDSNSKAHATNKEVCMATTRKVDVPGGVSIGGTLQPVTPEEVSREITGTMLQNTFSSCIKPEGNTSAEIMSFADLCCSKPEITSGVSTIIQQNVHASHEELEPQEYLKDVSSDAGGKVTTFCDKGINLTEASQILQEVEVTISENGGAKKSIHSQTLNEHEDEVNETAFLSAGDCLAIRQVSCENKSEGLAIETDDEAKCLPKFADKVLTAAHSKKVADFEHLDVISPLKCEKVVGCLADFAVGASSYHDAGMNIGEEEYGDDAHGMEVEDAAEDGQRCQLKLASPEKKANSGTKEERNSLSFYESSVMQTKNNRAGLIQGTPQKIICRSYMKENEPSIKKQQIGNMTAPKASSKRQALVAIRKNMI